MRAGRAADCKLTRLCSHNATRIVPTSTSLESFEMSPLRDDSHEGFVSVLSLTGPSVVGKALECVVVVKQHDVALEALKMIVLQQLKGEDSVRFRLGGWPKVVAEQLLSEGAGACSLVASTEVHGDEMTTVDVNCAEVVPGRDRIRAWAVIVVMA